MLGPALAGSISLLIALVTVRNWRYGLLCVIAVGVLQDVLRKITPGVPAYFIVWSLGVFAMVAMVAWSRHQVGEVNALWLGNKNLRTAFYLYFIVIVLQLLHSMLRWGSPAIPLFGGIFYLGPVIALLVFFAFARREIWVKRFIYVYLMIMVPVSLSVYLSPLMQDEVPVLREVGSFVGLELIIYDVGTRLYSYSGLLRVGEIAAFHAATSAAFLTILVYERDRVAYQRLAYLLLIVLLVGAILLTGRRKMLMALSIFWVLQFFMLYVLRRGGSRRAVVLLVLGLFLSIGLGVVDKKSPTSVYLDRGSSVFSSIGQRMETTLDLFQSALSRSGGAGLGAGVASQGMRYAGVDLGHYVGGASESGVGYIVLELGIPGLLVIGVLVLQLANVFWSRLKFVARVNDRMFVYCVSFFALLIANMATFITATQLYGDYFVLIVLGIVAGALYASIYHAKKRVALALKYSNLVQSR